MLSRVYRCASVAQPVGRSTAANYNRIAKLGQRYYTSLQVDAPLVSIKRETQGAEGTTDFRVFLADGKTGQRISAWHDIPLYAGKANDGSVVLNFINEIPRITRAKMEITKEEELNPIKQDIKKGNLRYIKYSPVLFNYGALPQTWEDPREVHPDTSKPGDGDPVDVIDLSASRLERGELARVKVVGALALIDEGETDWKILVIDVRDPVASLISGPADIEKHRPGALNAIRDYYANYKIPDGKAKNEFAFGGQVKDAEYALNVIHETHNAWKKLIANPPSDLKYSLKRSFIKSN